MLGVNTHNLNEISPYSILGARRDVGKSVWMRMIQLIRLSLWLSRTLSH